MSVNSFLTSSSNGTFNIQAANTWLSSKTTASLAPTSSRQYIDAAQAAILLSISGGITNANVAANANIDATKLGDGSINNTEFNYLNNCSSNIQTQLNNRLSLIGGGVGFLNVSGALQVAGDTTMLGNLSVGGTATFINTTNLEVKDPLVFVARDNSGSDVVDIGMFGMYNAGSGVRYASAFRDVSDNHKWKFYENISSQPTTTVDLTGANPNSIECNDVFMFGNFYKGGYQITLPSSAADTVCVLAGTQTLTNKTLTGPVINQIQHPTDINLFVGTTFGTNIVTVTENGAYIAASKDFFTNNVKGNTSSIPFLDFSGNTLLTLNQTQSILHVPYLFSGFGHYTSGIKTVSMSNVEISDCTSSTSVINITGAITAKTLHRVTGSGFVPFQEIKIVNSTTALLTVGNLVGSSNGEIQCLPNTMINPQGVMHIIRNSSGTRWNVLNQNYNDVFMKWQILPWINDDNLYNKLNTNQTYYSKVNFNNSTSTICGVSGFANATTQNTEYSNVYMSTGSALTGGTTNTYALTGTESSKFQNYVIPGSDLFLDIRNLTLGKIYEVVLLFMNFTNGDEQVTFSDYAIGNTNTDANSFRIAQRTFGSAVTNSPGVMVSYVFRNTKYDSPYAIRNKVTNSPKFAGLLVIDHGTDFEQ